MTQCLYLSLYSALPLSSATQFSFPSFLGNRVCAHNRRHRTRPISAGSCTEPGLWWLWISAHTRPHAHLCIALLCAYCPCLHPLPVCASFLSVLIFNEPDVVGVTSRGLAASLHRCMTREQRFAESKCFWQEDWSRPDEIRRCVTSPCPSFAFVPPAAIGAIGTFTCCRLTMYRELLTLELDKQLLGTFMRCGLSMYSESLTVELHKQLLPVHVRPTIFHPQVHDLQHYRG